MRKKTLTSSRMTCSKQQLQQKECSQSAEKIYHFKTNRSHFPKENYDVFKSRPNLSSTVYIGMMSENISTNFHLWANISRMCYHILYKQRQDKIKPNPNELAFDMVVFHSTHIPPKIYSKNTNNNNRIIVKYGRYSGKLEINKYNQTNLRIMLIKKLEIFAIFSAIEK